MTSFDEDFAAALRGDLGYSGIEPKTAAALYRLGILTEEQAWEEAYAYQADWNRAWDDSNWWWKTAELAWYNSASFWSRLFSAGIPSFKWRTAWIGGSASVSRLPRYCWWH